MKKNINHTINFNKKEFYKIAIICFLFFNFHFSYAQYKFTLTCKTSIVKDGYAIIAPSYSNTDLYEYGIKNDSVEIINNKFSFTGTIKYPQLFYIKMVSSSGQKTYVEDFFIDKTTQDLYIDTSIKAHNAFSVFTQGVILKKSASNREYFNKYLSSFISLNKKTDTIFKLFSQSSKSKDPIIKETFIKQRDSCRLVRDTMLYYYSIKNKTSEILPWMLYQHVEKYGYKDLYAKVLKNIIWKNNRLKKSVSNFLAFKKEIDIGKVIPNKNDLIDNLTHSDTSIKFILVDFWFSNCNPCIKQFEELREVYAKFNSLGFDIIAVSIDDSTHLSNYKNILNTKQYPWRQLIDSDARIANRLFIKKFPTNFLVDRNGKILRMDIEPTTLIKFLHKELTQ